MNLPIGATGAPRGSRLFGLIALAAFAAFFIMRGSDSVPVASDDAERLVDVRWATKPREPHPRRAVLPEPVPSDDRRSQSTHASGIAFDSVAGPSAGSDRSDSFEPHLQRESDSNEFGEVAAIPIVLNALSLEPGGPGIELSGFDPLGPRDLVAWRIKNGRRAIIARGSSDRDGEIHFPELVAPRNGLEIVVTAADGAPEVPGASAARRSNGPLPTAPNVVVLDVYGSEYEVRIVPSEATGEIWLADAEGRVFAQYAVPNTPIASSRVLDVTLGLALGDTHLLVAHALDDGRRSDWREIELRTPDGG